ncbi:hypothetical protein B0A55_05807 [Friedmanniomyces simplex]|uniref:Uncharacterized protein n=1 Tax=Friedmanniomyces simplex TaxID=329884 RepID=A0A4U0XNM8_9PEZI|nr:hypothetical protein B0A55_05807 [Friedmanniomyces simplex]
MAAAKEKVNGQPPKASKKALKARSKNSGKDKAMRKECRTVGFKQPKVQNAAAAPASRPVASGSHGALIAQFKRNPFPAVSAFIHPLVYSVRAGDDPPMPRVKLTAMEIESVRHRNRAKAKAEDDECLWHACAWMDYGKTFVGRSQIPRSQKLPTPGPDPYQRRRELLVVDVTDIKRFPLDWTCRIYVVEHLLSGGEAEM